MRDSDVRGAVRKWLRAEYAQEPDTRIVEEMGVWSGSKRIDVAVINGELNGFELKSDRDTLVRLRAQAEVYSRVFDNLTLIVGCRHAKKARAIIPEWWNVVVATQMEGETTLDVDHIGCANPFPDPYLIAQLLWRDEAVALLETNKLAKGWRSRSVKVIHERLASELPLQMLKDQVRAALKQRVAAGWLRQPMSNQIDMPVNAERNPCSSVS